MVLIKYKEGIPQHIQQFIGVGFPKKGFCHFFETVITIINFTLW